MLMATIPRTLDCCRESSGRKQLYHDSCNGAAAQLFVSSLSKDLAERRQPHVDDRIMCAARGPPALPLSERAG
jgi:hypothetical protein